MNDMASAADYAGGAASDAGAAVADYSETTLTGWQAVTVARADYAAKARYLGGNIAPAQLGALRGAENAICDFVKTGKPDLPLHAGSVMINL